MLTLPEEGKRMEYNIRTLSELAGVSTRTLRYYDEIGLLKPMYVNEAGYRYYGDKELILLQQILFYRERGFHLKDIQKILSQENFDVVNALEEHLLELEEQKNYLDSLIRTVKQTILSMKGAYDMNDQEKFEAFKQKTVKENEEKYGAEIRKRFGDEEMEATNQKLLNMSQKDWEHFQNLETEIYNVLKECVIAGANPESEDGKRIAVLHKEWIEKSWKQYTAAAHKSLAASYLCDERFKQYYDKEVTGCAEFLERAICYWVDKIAE